MIEIDDIAGETARQIEEPLEGGAASEESGAGSRRAPAQRLDFDVVIATRNRPEALALSIPLILGQSRRPQRLIVIDSSDDHARVAQTVADAVAEARWSGPVVVEHTGPGLPQQRNRGLAHVGAEIVFFPDDDSLFHPGTSEAIMRAYELDTGGRIAGVCAADAREPPPGVLSGAQYEMPSAARRRTRAAWRRKRLGLEFKGLRPQLYLGNLLKARFEPLDWFEDENCVLVEEMWGYRMSFRTSVLRANPFDEVLRAYALHEDMDASFSAMRQGALVGARNARIYHHKFPTGRGDQYTFGKMRLLNLSYVVLKNAHDADLAPAEAHELRRLVRQNCWLMMLRALPRAYRRSDREEVHGMLAALEGVRAMLNAPREDLARIYAESFARRARRAN